MALRLFSLAISLCKGNAAAIVDGDVNEVPSDAFIATALPLAREAAELLDIEMEHLAGTFRV